MTDFRQVISSPSQGSVKAKHRYYLCWLSPNGGVRSWLFSHTDGDQEDEYKSFMVESTDDLRAIPSEERKSVDAITVSLEDESFDYVKSILASNRVYQVFQNGTQTPIAIAKGKISRSNQSKEHIVRIQFMYEEADLLNV
jgi:hypothetical protein